MVGHTVARGGIKVDADYAGQFDFPGGFFEGFAAGGVEQALVGFQVPGGLVVDVFAGFEFLDHEEAALVFDDGRDSDVGVPGHSVGPVFVSRGKPAPTGLGCGSGLAPRWIPEKQKPRCVAGASDVTSSEPYRAAMALLRVWLGRITLLVSSASG
ncbi:hypothetical protein D3C79_915470 [compost metagenome]